MRLLVGFTCALVAFGCRDDGKVRRLPDAPPPEVDASPFGSVSLSVVEGTTPRAGVRVLFQNADSSVVLDTTTGTDGKASAAMAPGGYVTAIDPFGVEQPKGLPVSADLRTFAGVKPGDQLRLVQAAQTTATINVNIVLPISNSAMEYRVWTNCNPNHSIPSQGSGSQPQGVMELTGCGPTTNLLVQAIDFNFGIAGVFYKDSVALADNATLDFSTETYVTPPSVMLRWTNLPADIATVAFEGARITSLGRIFAFAEEAAVTGGTAQHTLRVPEIPGSTATLLTRFFGPAFTRHHVLDWGPAAATYNFDAANAFLPSFGGDASLDAANHTATWTATGGTAQPDFSIVEAILQRQSATQLWYWTIAAPTGTQAVFPVLPAPSALNIVAGDVGILDVTTGKVPGGYDAIRANIFALDGIDELVTGTSGRIVFAELQSQLEVARAPARTPVLRGLSPRTR